MYYITHGRLYTYYNYVLQHFSLSPLLLRSTLYTRRVRSIMPQPIQVVCDSRPVRSLPLPSKADVEVPDLRSSNAGIGVGCPAVTGLVVLFGRSWHRAV